MTNPAQPRFRHLRHVVGPFVALFLANCLFGPPSVPTSGALAPLGSKGGGPRSGSSFAVAYAGPRGEVPLHGDSTITVLFNRGMRLLETPEDQGLPTINVRTREGGVISGRLRWVGTRGFLFVPDSPIPGASRVMVTVPGATKALDGTPLGSNYAFEFRTPAPAVVRTSPSGGQNSLVPTSTFEIGFNQEVTPEAVQKVAHLVAHHADGDAEEQLAFRVTRGKASTRPAANERSQILITPEKPLPLDAAIELTLDAGLRGAEGPAPMDKPFTLHARTYGPLRLASFYCTRQVSEGRCKAHHDVKVTLSNPVDHAEFVRHLKAPGLLPTAAAKVQAAAAAKVQAAKAQGAKGRRPDEPGGEHWLAADPQLGKRYTVTLTAGMKDIFGQVLGSDLTFDIDIESPFTGVAPAASKDPHKAAKPIAKGVPKPAKPAAPTTVATGPHRPLLTYDLQIGLAGNVVEALATTGTKSHKIPIGSVNIPSYEMTAAALTVPQTFAFFDGNSLGDFLQRNHVSPKIVSTGAPENARAVSAIDLDALLGKSGRGVALVAVDVPGGSTRQRIVRVTDLGVSAKASRQGSLVWITSLATGKPVPSAAVSVRTPKDGELFAGRTDDSGLCEIPGDRFDPFGDQKGQAKNSRGAFLYVRSGDDWTYQAVERSGADHRIASSFQDFDGKGDVLGMLYTERGIYRPGETVKVAGIFRAQAGGGLRPLIGEELRIEATDARGDTVFTNRLKLDNFGAFATDVVIPKSAHIGESRVVATLKSRDQNTEVTKNFLLSDYKASEFKVAVEVDAKSHIRGEMAAFSVKGEYLFGGPMAKSTVHSTVTRTVTTFVPPGADDFVTTDEAGPADGVAVNARSGDVGAFDDTLDPTGRASRAVPLAMAGQTGPERLMLEAEVEDLSHQTVAERASTLVHPAEFYLGIKRPKERFVSAGGPLHADLLALEPSGAHRANVSVKLELLERKWTVAVEEHGDASAHRTSRYVDTIVGACDIRTDVALRGCDLKVPNVGYYVLRATSKDPRGNPVMVSETLYGLESASQPQAPMVWGDSDTRRVKLDANKSVFDIGETARFLVRNPFREADALVSVERNGILSRKVVHLTGPMPTIDVPVTPGMFPNAFVSVHLVRGRVAAPPESGADLGGPDFRIGYAELTVKPDSHRLAVTVKSQKAEYRPAEEVDVDVAVADHDGKPVESQLTFFAVDEGVLMLTGFQTPDPLPAFVHRRPLSVFTVEGREDLAQVLPLRAGERVAIQGFEYPSRGDKGYPGGGGAAAQQQRSEFKTTAYFEAGKVTSREGKAHLHFKLPGNLTTYRLMAVAANATDFFGSGDAKIVVNRKIMARPALPRFVRVGDAFDAGVIVSSKDLPEGDVEVTFGAKGVTYSGERVRHVNLPKGGSTEVRFPVIAQAPGDAEFEFSVKSGGEGDSVKVKRKVDLPLLHETVAAYGETREAAAVALGDLATIHPGSGEVRLRMAPTALVGLATSMEDLLEYPYGCTEQLASRTLPLVALGDLAKDFGVHLPKNVPHAVDEAVEAILKNQRSDGGLGFWSDSERSEPWLSAYVAITLDAAKKSGRDVPASAIESLASYLRSAIGPRLPESDADEKATPPEPGDPADVPIPASHRTELSPEEVVRVHYANAAFLVDGLSTTGSPSPGYMTRLYDTRRGKPIGARALLLHALAVGKATPEPIATLAKEIEADLRIEADMVVARADADDAAGMAILETTARTTALVLRGLLAANPAHPLASRLARGLLSLRENGAWASTQENGWALLALRDYRAAQESSAAEFEGRAYLGSDVLGTQSFKGTGDADATFTATGDRLAKGNSTVTFQVLGKGRLFYAAELHYAATLLPKEARDRGLFVKKLLRSVKADELREAAEWIPKQSSDGATAGDLVLTDLLLESSESRRQVVIDDPLPAGLEAVDTNLETAAKSRGVKDDDGEEQKVGKGNAHPGALTGIGAAFQPVRVHREVKDDRVLTFIENLPPGMYHFRYLARATAVGRFVVPPTRVEAMYNPDVSGSTAVSAFEVRAKK